MSLEWRIRVTCRVTDSRVAFVIRMCVKRGERGRRRNDQKKEDNSAEIGEGHSERSITEGGKPEPRMKWASMRRSKQDCQMLPCGEREATHTRKGPLESFNTNWKTSRRERMETQMGREWGTVSGDA